MNLDLVNRITRAILYEGYLLYPYRASATKNRHRWTFGALYPRPYSGKQGGTEPVETQTQVLTQGSVESVLNVRLRFLQLVSRESEGQTWQEAEEREVLLDRYTIQNLLGEPVPTEFSFPAAVRKSGAVVRRQEAIYGTILLSALETDPGIFRITLIVRNDHDYAGTDREEALMHATVSTHSVFEVEGGNFISLLEPPDSIREIASACSNKGNWPVLVGAKGETAIMLASPIILYDYPELAPESQGDLFDSTEIDEILLLRIMTLTDEEKEEMRKTDERARKMLEHAENMSPEQFSKLHGVLRNMRPVSEKEEPLDAFKFWEEKPALESVLVFGREVRKGNRVRLWPVKTADIMDMALNGKVAVVDSIEEDYEGKVQLAVVVEDDPGRDLGELRQPGHRFFFTPEEVEPL